MKYLVFKIAAGVFLGVLAAFGMYVSFAMWQRHVAMKELAEQEQRKIAMHQKARAKAAQDLTTLTPEELLTRCGEPISSSNTASSTHMSYLGADGHRIDSRFLCSKGSCFFFEMAKDRPHSYDSWQPTPYESYQTKDEQWHTALSTNQVDELPCLIVDQQE